MSIFFKSHIIILYNNLLLSKMQSKQFFNIVPPTISESDYFQLSTQPGSTTFTKRFFDDNPVALPSGIINIHDNAPIGIKRKFKKIVSMFREETENEGPHYSEYARVNLGYNANYTIVERCRDGYVVIGAFGFTKRNKMDHFTNEVIEQRFELSWVWIHPYRRGSGVFSNLWEKLRNYYGQFDVQRPYSLSMQKFLMSKFIL